MATLCLLDQDGVLGTRWELTNAPVTVGRGAAVDVKVEDDSLSRQHFMIAREGSEYVIKDLSSRNGTWVHGHRAVIARLQDNDCILAGHTLFRFSTDIGAPPAGTPVPRGPHGTQILCPAHTDTA
jgi:pSer/pThr/pTyr-binding forkhead associated (FHA) protein